MYLCKIYYRCIIVLLICLLVNSAARSQQLLGLSTDNYNGIYSLHHNPASIADAPYNFQFNAFLLNYSISGDFLSNMKLWGPMYPMRRHYQSEELYGASLLNGNIAATGDLNVNSLMMGPSLMIKLGYFSSLAITTRVRSLIGGVGIPAPLMAAYGGDEPEMNGMGFLADPFFINSHLFSETGLTYARTVFSGEMHFLKAGISLKKVNGLRFSYLEVDNLNYDVSSDRISVNSMDYRYASSGAVLEDMGVMQLFFGNSLTPSALATDLGMVYEFRPKAREMSYFMNGKMRTDPSKPAYLVRIGAGLTDLGSLNYAGTETGTYQGTATDLSLGMQDWEQIGNNAEASLRNRLGMEGPFSNESVEVQLPTAFNLSADLRITNTFYLNMMTWQSLDRSAAADMRGQNFMAVTPRLESGDGVLALPVKLVNEQVNFGLAFKLGPFIMGTDHLLGIFSSQPNNASNFYMGINIFNIGSKEGDKDNDGTSDKYDQCPDIPGLWEFRGCPDYDADGIEDKVDSCPMVAGLIEYGGCPDTDADGLPDVSDRCPEVAGSLALYGCPDTDGDQVPDYLDDCPEAAGLPGFYGCPDTDGDGIYDGDDGCPEVAGSRVFGGCPDSDGDGLPDDTDECPELPGLQALQGCPDSDGDGVADAKDRCPEIAGSADALGCPDRDEDGVPDKFDLCPDDFGDVRNEGCPQLTSYDEIRLSGADRAMLDKANANLRFTGSNDTQVAASSLTALNALARYLTENPEYRLVVLELEEGEVEEADDGWGSFKELYRANAVADYLAEQGIFLDRVVIQTLQLNEVPQNMEINTTAMVKMVVVR